MISPFERPIDGGNLDDDSWRVFRIISEFVDGFETMTSLGPSVAIFGSSTNFSKESKYYGLAREFAHKIASKGFGVITGGGPGIMEAGNIGAQKAKGKSCGLCISLPTEEPPNAFIDPKYHLSHRYFFVRKVMFVRFAQAFVIFPGGYGTLDEFFESITLIQTKRIKSFPVFLIGSEYWKGLIDWMQNTLITNKLITENDLSFFTLTDDLDHVVKSIEEHYQKNLCLKNF